MAIELEIPEDIRKSEKRVIGPLTKRQVTFCIPAVIFGLIAFELTKNVESSDVRIGAIFFSVLPFLLLGFVKVYGLPLHQFLKVAFISNVLSPKNRIYKTENTFAFATEENSKIEEQKTSGKKAPKKPKVSKKSSRYIQYK